MLSDPPAPNQLEVSIFGPGRGEAVVVHLGDGDWLVVDSCRDQRSRKNSVLEYLKAIGADLGRVKLVVGSHAHDDHVAGIAEVLSECVNASFVTSRALTHEDFLAYVALENADRFKGLRKRIYSEYSKVLSLVLDRKRHQGGASEPLVYALQGRSLFERSGGAVPCRVIALSPSDEAVTEAERILASFVVEGAISQKSDPNHLAIALYVEVGGKSAILGADLETGPPGCKWGWEAVLSYWAADRLSPLFRSDVYKVPHHGSQNGHYDEVWEEMLVDNPIALLAPFRGGENPPPNAKEVRDILDLTDRAYIAALPRRPPATSAAHRAAAELGPLAFNVRELYGVAGHVRARWLPDVDRWNVEMVHPARALRSVL